MKQDRLFTAIGSADPALLLRSETFHQRAKGQHWLKWAVAAAACLALCLSLLFFQNNDQGGITAPPQPPDPSPVALRLSGSEVGTLHLLQMHDDLEIQEGPDFVLYINENLYHGGEENGVYRILPLDPLPADFPTCSLEIVRRPGVPPDKAAEESARWLKADFDQVTDCAAASQVEGLFLHGDNGDAWNAEQIDVTFVDDGAGGCFVLTARYFTEATEGHGVRFSDMVGTFQAVTAEVAPPIWLAALRDAAGRLTPALFAHQLETVSDLVAEGASINVYEDSIADQVSVRSIDYTFDNDQTPTAAVVSVKHRTNTEEGYDYLTMELTWQDGAWLLHWAGLEK